MFLKYRDFLLVAGQFVIIIALRFRADDPLAWGSAHRLFMVLGLLFLWAGLIVLVMSAIALGSSLTAVPKPKAHAELKTHGLYSRVRHPIYSALMLLAIGVTFINGPWPQLLFTAALIGLLNYKARYEETLLLAKYENYAEYSKTVNRFIPKFRRK